MRFRVRDGALVSDQDPAFYLPAPKRSDLPSPMVISDHLEVMSMADGKHYDSKSAYYRSVRAAGCEIVGNERPTQRDPTSTPGGVERDIKTAIEQLGSGT